ncbi:MAG: alpha/beta hydrolase [Elusimicrobiota bacterium]|jgi:fermentation-respiration switch protein FrsA (DUF1100 family)
MTVLWMIIGAIIVLIVSVAWYASLEITRIPYLEVPYRPDDFGWTYETVSFRSFDGLRLSGWFVPAATPSPVTIIIQHGIGSNAGDMLLNTACLQRVGRWNLFYYNFRGHADSEGKRTSLGPLELKDLDNAIAFLKSQKPECCKRLGIYGHSLGAAVAIAGAAQHPELSAVAAESSFSYIYKTVRHFSWLYYSIPYFPFIPLALWFASLRLGRRIGDFAPVEAIRKIAPRPLLLIQPENDRRTPMWDFAELVEAAGEPKSIWVVPGADHGEPWMVDKEGYEQRLVNFFIKAFESGQGG